MIKGNHRSFLSYKYIFLLFSVLFIAVLVGSYSCPECLSENSNIDFSKPVSKLVILIIACLFLVLYFFFEKKLVLINAYTNYLGLKKSLNGNELEIQWKDIESVKLVQFVVPPLCILRLKKGDWYLFSTGYSFVNVNGITHDHSDIRRFIQERIDTIRD